MSGNQVISITSGTTYTFYDADRTKVSVKLMGSGSGQLTLTNGLGTGGSIDTLMISGTNSTTQLKITASGGTDGVSTLNNLYAWGGTSTAMKQFTGSGMNLSPNGEIVFYGGVDNFSIENIGVNAAIDVAGPVGTFTATAMQADSALAVVGAISSFKATNVGVGAEIIATQIAKISITGLANGANFEAGTGGIQSAFFSNIVSSNVTSLGNIGPVVIQASSAGSTLASNRSAGLDSVFGTIDDFTVNASAAGNIGTVTLNGAVGAGANALQLIATGTVGTVTVPAGQPQPTVIDGAMSQFIPLEIAQAVANATGFDDDDVWIAVFGEEIITPGTGQVPAPGKTYYLDANSVNIVGSSGQPTPIPVWTGTLEVGINTPNQAILPSSTIADWANASSIWGSNLQFPAPAPGHQFTGRILISVGAPVQAQVNASDGSVASPSASNPADPSSGTFYDFLEFTVTNKAGVVSLDVDTSQVDAFGLPMTLQFFQDAQGQNPINTLFTGSTTSGSNTITSVTNISLLSVGQVVTGTGIPAGAIIDSITKSTTLSANTITLSVAATATNASASLAAENGGPVGVDGTRNEILDPANPNSLMTFLQVQLTAGNAGARPFLQSASPFEIVGGVPITGVTTASNTVTITTDSTAGLVAGDQVVISGILGATAANGTFTIANVTANTFTLNGLTSTLAYSSGGEWKLAITGASNPGGGQPIVITASSTAGLQNGDLVEISGVAGNGNANGFYFISSVTATTFTLEGSDGSGAAYTSGGTWRVYDSGPRLVAPKDIVEMLPSAASSNQLNNYYNEAIDAFFLKYLPSTQSASRGGQTYYGGGETFSIQSAASGTNLTYTGTVKNVAGFGYLLYMTTPGGSHPFVIFYPFTNSNLPSDYTPLFATVDAPAWLVATGKQTQSASQMIFACDAFFADNTFRAATFKMSTTWSAVLGDLEDSIAAAFNRGIALNDPSTWGDRSTWFQQNNDQDGQYNYWVQYWHESGLAVNDLAYAFPYDDKYGSSTNLNVASVGLARVLLNSWSATQQSTTTSFTGFPTSAQQGGTITLTANVAPSGGNPMPTGTVTFFIDGVAINSNNFGAAPPWQPAAVDGSGNATVTATLPALADGSTTHTYTVTAIYSGDATSAPSVAYQSLKLVGVNGDFLMTLTPDAAPLGTSVGVTATLPGSVFDGTVAFSASLSDGSGVQSLGPPVAVTGSAFSSNITIPTNLVSFTGDIATGSNIITNVSNVVNVLAGQTLTNSNLSGGSQLITSVTPPSVTLNQAAILSGIVTFQSNGVTFTATATAGQTSLTGLNTLAGLATSTAVTQISSVSNPVLSPGTTITALVAGEIEVQTNATGTATGTTIISNGVGAVIPVTATFTPTIGGPYIGTMTYVIQP